MKGAGAGEVAYLRGWEGGFIHQEEITWSNGNTKLKGKRTFRQILKDNVLKSKRRT